MIINSLNCPDYTFSQYVKILRVLIVQAKQLGSMLDEDPAIMERRAALAKRLELYRSAQAEIDAVAWSK